MAKKIRNDDLVFFKLPDQIMSGNKRLPCYGLEIVDGTLFIHPGFVYRNFLGFESLNEVSMILSALLIMKDRGAIDQSCINDIKILAINSVVDILKKNSSLPCLLPNLLKYFYACIKIFFTNKIS